MLWKTGPDRQQGNHIKHRYVELQTSADKRTLKRSKRSCTKRKILYFVWPPPWHLYALLLANLLAFLSDISSDILSGILSGKSSGILSGKSSGILSGKHSGTFIWHTFWHIFWHFIWRIFWHCIWHAIWRSMAYLLAFYLDVEVQRWSQVEVQRCSLSSAGPRLRSSGAHWARRVPGWGPAVLTELGRSQVEVQRCPVRSDPCSWGPAVPTACGSWRRAWGRVGKTEVDMEVEAEVVEENGEEEEGKKNNSDKI